MHMVFTVACHSFPPELFLINNVFWIWMLASTFPRIHRYNSSEKEVQQTSELLTFPASNKSITFQEEWQNDHERHSESKRVEFDTNFAPRLSLWEAQRNHRWECHQKGATKPTKTRQNNNNNHLSYFCRAQQYYEVHFHRAYHLNNEERDATMCCYCDEIGGALWVTRHFETEAAT